MTSKDRLIAEVRELAAAMVYVGWHEDYRAPLHDRALLMATGNRLARECVPGQAVYVVGQLLDQAQEGLCRLRRPQGAGTGLRCCVLVFAREMARLACAFAALPPDGVLVRQ
ncbi:hypothetical protein [Nitratidesulfovibrio termitidis]|uniref:hypothetical protein n=1 Tax=Nitratidesulfovibrio termitidis TaxID=42252 RepID=UPI0005587DA7|nr:hypothetical protein [Nitratidesulfovibrio termitidis]